MISTLVIGLGGFGGQVVAKMKQRMIANNRKMDSYKFILLDRNSRDLDDVCRESGIPGVQMRLGCPCGQYILKHPDRENIRKWFPEGPAWFDATDADTGLRVLGRLAFLQAMEQGIGRRLEYMLAKAGIGQNLRIVIVTSLAGGTGSGCFIQLAQLLRNRLYQHWGINPQICGFFAGAEVFRWAGLPYSQMSNLRANAHGALRELHWLTKVRLHAISPPKRIVLDHLMDSYKSEPLMTRVIFNQAYVYDAGEEAKKNHMAVQDHVKNMAESLYERYGSSATGTIDALQKGKTQWNLGVRVYVPLTEDVQGNRSRFADPDSAVECDELPMAQVIRYISMYNRLCRKAMEAHEPGPHMDKQWPAWLMELW